MNLLVAADGIRAGRALARLLSHAGHTIEVVVDGGAAIALLQTTRFDVFVYDSPLSDPRTADTLARLRTTVQEPPVLLLVSTEGGRQARQRAVAAGADDCVVKPFETPDLLDAIARALQHRAGSWKGLKASARPRPSRAPSPMSVRVGATPAIETTVAWADLMKTVRMILRQTTGIEFKYEAPGTGESGSVVGAAAFMVDVTSLVEVACGLFVNKASGNEIAAAVLRTSPIGEPAVRELLAELGNNVLGHLKTALRREGFLFTIGLGQPAGMPTSSSFLRCFAASSVFAFSGGGACVKVVVGARPAMRVSVPGRKLREDMVVAADLTGDGGDLLIPAGTRLTSSTIERVSPHLSRGMVQVCTPATRW